MGKWGCVVSLALLTSRFFPPDLELPLFPSTGFELMIAESKTPHSPSPFSSDREKFCTVIWTQAHGQISNSFLLSDTHSKTTPLPLDALAFYITNRTRWHLNSTPFHPPWTGPMTSWPNIQFPLLLRVWLHTLFPDQGFHSLFCTFFLTWNVLLLGLAPCICEH